MVYIVSQLILVFRTLEDRWPVGDIVFGTAFFAVAQVILFAFSVTICDAIKHYIDGLFFFTLCILLSVMMVYKYWDSITVRKRRRRLIFGAHTLTVHPCLSLIAGGSGVLRWIKDRCLGSQRLSNASRLSRRGQQPISWERVWWRTWIPSARILALPPRFRPTCVGLIFAFSPINVTFLFVSPSPSFRKAHRFFLILSPFAYIGKRLATWTQEHSPSLTTILSRSFLFFFHMETVISVEKCDVQIFILEVGC